MTILIAEDQQVFQELYSLVLGKLGIAFVLAVDGQDALEKALSSKPDIVLMDIQMPIMDGYEASKKLREQGFDKPIIAVTASDSLEEWDYCHKAGIDDLLRKPLKPAELKSMIDKWMYAERDEYEEEAEYTPYSLNEVFNSAALIDTFLNNEEMALSLLLRFIERTQDQIETILDLEKTGEWESARQIAHMIRGAAHTMSGSELSKTASRLEMAYKNMDTEEIAAAYPLLKNAFEHFKKEAEDFIELRS